MNNYSDLRMIASILFLLSISVDSTAGTLVFGSAIFYYSVKLWIIRR